ncbi:MAG TPA: amidohydrolase family protein [Ramlibacter sp.]|nr:amidohydrolase family protein [Ramlibacter sp.]
MKIIDSQLHCFYPNTPARPWPEGVTSPHGPQFTIEQARALLDQHGVQGAVLVPPSWNGWDNQYSLDAAVAEPKRFGVMGRFDIEAPDAQERLKTWRQQPGMLGVRVFIMGQPWMSLLAPEQDWFWKIAEETRLPVMAHIPGNIAGFDPVLQRHPELRLIIDHAGRHPRGAMDEGAWADVDQLHALARFRNVSVKVSSLPCFSTQPYPFPNLHAPIRAMYDRFGPQRLHWGSDMTRLSCSYEENIKLFTQALDFLSAEDKEWIMGRALAAALDWEA